MKENVYNMKDIGENNDGYHSFNELYEHRHLLFLNLINHRLDAWKSAKHSDASMYNGYFIAGTILDSGKDISYHLPDKYWNHCHCKHLAFAPNWDGHTPKDVCDRLLENLELDNEDIRK